MPWGAAGYQVAPHRAVSRSPAAAVVQPRQMVPTTGVQWAQVRGCGGGQALRQWQVGAPLGPVAQPGLVAMHPPAFLPPVQQYSFDSIAHRAHALSLAMTAPAADAALPAAAPHDTGVLSSDIAPLASSPATSSVYSFVPHPDYSRRAASTMPSEVTLIATPNQYREGSVETPVSSGMSFVPAPRRDDTEDGKTTVHSGLSLVPVSVPVSSGGSFIPAPKAEQTHPSMSPVSSAASFVAVPTGTVSAIDSGYKSGSDINRGSLRADVTSEGVDAFGSSNYVAGAFSPEATANIGDNSGASLAVERPSSPEFLHRRVTKRKRKKTCLCF
eukprot:TRINITY_DN49372_c0_g1_i1.p1 TRINITY_DN49372_c0_g1~~TRINITY_DN49372_c0_g1_i1.p1  ORF type:complete len:362 (+),score=39.96 TRINITY_DN49372_c0_g1_i1:103-1086(+)